MMDLTLNMKIEGNYRLKETENSGTPRIQGD